MRWYEKKFRAIRAIADAGAYSYDPTTLNNFMIAIRDMCDSAIKREERVHGVSRDTTTDNDNSADLRTD